MKIYARIASSLLAGSKVELPITGLPCSEDSLRRQVNRELRAQEKFLGFPRHRLLLRPTLESSLILSIEPDTPVEIKIL